MHNGSVFAFFLIPLDIELHGDNNITMFIFFICHNVYHGIKTSKKQKSGVLVIQYITRMDILNVLKRQQPHRDENVNSSFNERRGKLHTTGQAAAGHKTTFYSGTAKKLPLYTSAT